MGLPPLHIVEADPQGVDAMALLRAAAAEVRALYPDLHGPADPPPGNAPTPARGAYLVAYRGGRPVGMGAHRPMDATRTELRRMFTAAEARRTGVARAILVALEAHARAQGFAEAWLETGCRQAPAIALYTALGWRRIPPFGPHADDPTSVCFAKDLGAPAR